MSECGCSQASGKMRCYDEAVAQLLAAAKPLDRTEILSIEQALGRIMFARPFILKMQGATHPLPTPLTLEAGFDWPKPDKRREYARGRLEIGADGKARVDIFPSRSSGVLSSVAWANGLAVIPENQTLKRGDPVQFLSFGELLS